MPPQNGQRMVPNQAAIMGQAVAVPQTYQEGMNSVLDIIAPAALDIKPNYIRLGNTLARTLFVFTYPSYVQTNWLAPIINYVLDCFGPDRVMFGSDWPVCTTVATLAEWVAALQTIVRGRSEEEQRKLFHDNALRTYGLS